MSETEVDKRYDDFWRKLVENEDGSLNKEQIKKELFDYSTLLKNAPIIFDCVTGGKATKPFTDPRIIEQLADENYAGCHGRDFLDTLESLKQDVLASLEDEGADIWSLQAEVEKTIDYYIDTYERFR